MSESNEKLDCDVDIKELNIYRDTPVRLLGYANEVGESFRSVIGKKWVHASYGLAILYVLADTATASARTFKENRYQEQRLKKTLFATTDCLIWQMLASVFVPGFTINRVCAISNHYLKKSEKISRYNRKLYVVGIGLATIPFIVRPIDVFVDIVLDMSLRKYIY